MLEKQRCYAFTQANKRIVAGLLVALLLLTMQLMNISYAYESTTIPLGKPMLFKNISSVTTDSNGTVYASDIQDSYISLIHKIDANGIYLGSIKIDFYASALVVDTVGNIYAYNGKAIRKFTAKGELIKKWPVKVTPPSYPLKLFIDSKNNLYFSGTKALVVYNSEGQLLNRVTHITNANSLTPVYKPQIIDINNKDRILVRNGNGLYQINTSGKLLEAKVDLINFSSETERKLIVAYDDLNQFYFMSSACSCLQVYSNNGQFIKKIGAYGVSKGHFKIDANIIISNKNNNLIVSDYISTRIQSISYESASVWSMGDELGRIASGHYSNISFALDSMNNIYILDKNYNRVNKLNSSGTLINTWNLPTEDDNRVEILTITIDYNDRVYINDGLHNHIYSVDGLFLGDAPFYSNNFDRKNNRYELIYKNDNYFINKYDVNNQLTNQSHIEIHLEPVSIYSDSSIWSTFLINSKGEFYLHESFYHEGRPNGDLIIKFDPISGKSIESIETGSQHPVGLDTNDRLYYTEDRKFLDTYDKSLKLPGRLINKSLFHNGSYSLFQLARNDQVYILSPNKDSTAALSLEILPPLSTIDPPISKTVIRRGSKGAVTVKWQDNNNAETGFNIYRCKMVYQGISLGHTCYDYQLVATSPANTQQIRLASPIDYELGDIYEYRVTTLKGNEESLASEHMY